MFRDHRIGNRLRVHLLDHRVEQLLVIADRSSLGEMRRHYHKQTEAVLLGEIDKQLTGLPSPDILKAIEAA